MAATTAGIDRNDEIAWLSPYVQTVWHNRMSIRLDISLVFFQILFVTVKPFLLLDAVCLYDCVYVRQKSEFNQQDG